MKLKDLYVSPDVEILKFKAALAIAAEESTGFEFDEGDKEEDGDAD